MFGMSCFATKKDYEDYLQSYREEKIGDALTAVSSLILATPTSKYRNYLTDMQIYLHEMMDLNRTNSLK